MAELTQLDSAKLYGNNNSGCIWGLFHIFDFYSRRPSKRLLSYRKLGLDADQRNLRIDNVAANDKSGGGDAVVVKEENDGAEIKTSAMNKRSSRTRILNFISKKLLKRQKRTGKMSHSSAQLKKSVSIHRSESNDSESLGELCQMTTDGETSTVTLSLDEMGSLAANAHETLEVNELQRFVNEKRGAFGTMDTVNDISSESHMLDDLGNYLLNEHTVLKKKIFEARDALLKQKDSDPKGVTLEFCLLSKFFLDTLHLFNTNREALYSALKSQNTFSSNDTKGLGCHDKARALNRSVSLSGFDLPVNAAGFPIPSHKRRVDDSLINQGSKSQSADLQIKTFGDVPGIEVLPGSNELESQGETKIVSSQLRELKHSIKSELLVNKMEHHRISMDRILDKVPLGHSLLGDEEGDKMRLREGSVHEKYSYKGVQGFKFNRVTPVISSIGKLDHDRVRRSHSFDDSLDRYSHLLDSITDVKVRKVPDRSKSTSEFSGSRKREQSKTHRRMMSNPDFLGSDSFTKDVQNEVHPEFQSSNDSTFEHLDCDLKSTACSFDKLDGDLVVLPATEEVTDMPEESNESSIAVKTEVSDVIVIPTAKTSSNEMKEQEKVPDSANGCLQTTPFQFSKIVQQKSGFVEEQRIQIEDKLNIKPETRSPISVLDTNIEEPVSPLKLTVLEGSDVQQLHKILEEQFTRRKIQDDVDSNELNVAELFEVNETNSFLANADDKDTAIFNYVKHILNNSGYEALFCEAEDPSNQIDAWSHIFVDIPFEEQLIFELINEVLFEIYEYSTAPSSWLSRFHSKNRSMPAGSYLLEEVWTEIRWHICSPHEYGANVDEILARNFTKTDGWMNLYRDAECFGMLLEQVVLDDLVDEVIQDIYYEL